MVFTIPEINERLQKINPAFSGASPFLRVISTKKRQLLHENSYMKNNNRIYILYNALTGKLKMNIPYSKYIIFCLGTGFLLLMSSPFIHAIAPNGFFK
jgi:hypothetical protein